MSIKLMTKVWENGPEDRTEAMVLLALADRANDDGSSCFPSIAEVSQRSRLSRRGTQKVIRRLDDKGYLTVHENEGPGGTNNYKLHPERLGGRTEFAGGGEHDSPGGEPDDEKGRSTFARNRQEPSDNRQKNREGGAPAHEDPVDCLEAMWAVRPTAYQKDRIRQVVDDVDAWEDVLDELKMQNKDSKKAIGWAVEDYQDRPTGDGAPASKYYPSDDPDL